MESSGAMRSLVNARDLQFECARVLYETFIMAVPVHVSEIIIWKEKERSRSKPVQRDKLREFLGIRGWIKYRMHV